MQIEFLGAAGEVTGSQHLVRTAYRTLLLDCGLVQGNDAGIRNGIFTHDPADVDAVILSHAHVDHCGNLPAFVQQGFGGPIFCTPATADVAALMLADCARIQEEDAKSDGRRPEFSRDHVRSVTRQFETLAFDEWHEVGADVRIRFRQAGHILGSAFCELWLDDRASDWRLTFSGDIGPASPTIVRAPQAAGACDVLICESTYGNRAHPPGVDVEAHLERIVTETVARGGRVIVPAFSLGRAQHVLYLLSRLAAKPGFALPPIYLDSPLAARVSDVYQQHSDDLQPDVRRLMTSGRNPFEFPDVTITSSQKESMALNQETDSLIVIAGSGMCDAGRIQHHLNQGIDDERNTIVITGFQAPGTLGRRIADRHSHVELQGRTRQLKANVEVMTGLSSHADATDLLGWVEEIASNGGVGQAFLVHGENDAASGLASLIEDCCNETPVIPRRGDVIDL